MENIRNELEVLNNRFIWLYRQKRYPEAIREAERGLKLAGELPHLKHTYGDIFKNNLQAAFLKYNRVAGKSCAGLQRGALPRAKRGFGRNVSFLPSLPCVWSRGIYFGIYSLTLWSGKFTGRLKGANLLIWLPRSEKSRPECRCQGKVCFKSAELKESILIEAPYTAKPELHRVVRLTYLLLQYAGVLWIK